MEKENIEGKDPITIEGKDPINIDCTSMIYNPKDWEATLGVDSSKINFGHESMQVRMYSEEEVLDITKQAYSMGRSNYSIKAFNEWFEQFKNK